MVVKDACQHRVQVISNGARQVGETRGQVCFQGCAVDGADISRHDVRRPGKRNGDVEVADDAGVVRGDGVRHRGRLHKMVVRCVQQPVQDVSFVMSGLTDSLGQIKCGQEIHYSGSGWVQGVVVMHVEVAKDDGGAM